MKKKLAAALALILIISCMAPLLAFADGLYDETYSRVYDAVESLTEAQIESLENTAGSMAETYGLDIVMGLVDADSYDDSYTLDDLADDLYDAGNYGYGENRDGYAVVYCPETTDVAMRRYGRGALLIPQSFEDFCEERAYDGYYEKYGDWGVLYFFPGMIMNQLESKEVTKDSNGLIDTKPQVELPSAPDPDAVIEETTPNRAGTEGLPSWYPEDISQFTFFHDADASRVVDEADILTTDEEAQILARIARIAERCDKDVVIYTNMSSFGKSRMEVADDFFDYNGYGMGPDREGMCLYVCMDPNNRGYWTSCTGPVTMGLFTEVFANIMDDTLYDGFVAKQYGEGILNWLEMVECLYTKGRPVAPAWMADLNTEINRFNRAEAAAPYFAGSVCDDWGILSESDIVDLSVLADELANQYGMDVVLHYADNDFHMGEEAYARAFYQSVGVGRGVDHNGLLVTMFRSNQRAVVYAEGAAAEKLTEANKDRIKTKIDNALYYEGPVAAGEVFLKNAEHMMRTGRVTLTKGSITFTAVASAIVGMIYAGSSLSSAKKTMVEPVLKTNANEYVVQGSFSLRNSANIFLHTTQTRTYSPQKTQSSSSGGSGSSGRSSYSSSHSSSSGSSHSGSGRSF